MTDNLKDKSHPWDDNLPKNKEYIKKFYKKSEKQIKEQVINEKDSNKF